MVFQAVSGWQSGSRVGVLCWLKASGFEVLGAECSVFRSKLQDATADYRCWISKHGLFLGRWCRSMLYKYYTVPPMGPFIV